MSTLKRLKQLEVKKIYSFDTQSPEVLGTRMNNVMCIGVLSAQDAIAGGLDVISFHERMRPHLPNGYNNDPMTMVYVKIKATDGKETIIAMDWINLDTLKETNPTRALVEINDVSISDAEIIRRALAIQGYTDVNISFPED